MSNSIRKLNLLAASLSTLLLASCTNIEIETGFIPDVSIHDQIISQTEDRFADIDPLYISDEIKEMIDGHVSRYDTEVEKVRKLQDILYNEEFLYIQYDDEETFTALEAFEERRGNCLGVVNLYIGMARYLGLDANFQTVRVQPSWDKRGDLLVLSEHINATGRLTAARYYVVDFTPEIALQQLTSRIISDEAGRALYFNNLGVEAMIAADLENALIYFKNAIFLDPQLAIAWNNIGAVYNRLNQNEFAEYSYKMAFSADGRSPTAINNLAKFYQRIGNNSSANEYRRAVERFNDRNPYYHFAQGSLAFEQSDLMAAQRSFERALRLKEEEPDFYTALAQVEIRLGNIREAQRLTDSAEALIVENAEIYRPSTDKLRIINRDSVLRDYMPGFSIEFN